MSTSQGGTSQNLDEVAKPYRGRAVGSSLELSFSDADDAQRRDPVRLSVESEVAGGANSCGLHLC